MSSEKRQFIGWHATSESVDRAIFGALNELRSLGLMERMRSAEGMRPS